MSVVVLGLDMPETGWKCYVNQLGSCKVKDISCGKYISSRCPLRPLPDHHGRLIDADVLELGMQELWEANEISNGDWLWFREELNNQETIVEAEGE